MAIIAYNIIGEVKLDKYLEEKILSEENEKEADLNLIKEVIKAKIDLEIAIKNFEYAEGDLIDYYTYHIKATQSKLNYLLKKVKNKSLVLDMINEINLRLNQDEAV